MANTPHTTTRVTAGRVGAPPKRADTMPSRTKPTMVSAANDQTRIWAGNTKMPMTGNMAPVLKANAEAMEACRGFA